MKHTRLFIAIIFSVILTSCSLFNNENTVKCKVINYYTSEPISGITIVFTGYQNTGIMSQNTIANISVKSNKSGDASIDYSSKVDHFQMDANPWQEALSPTYPYIYLDNDYSDDRQSSHSGESNANFTFRLRPNWGVWFDINNKSNIAIDSLSIELYHQKQTMFRDNLSSLEFYVFKNTNQTYIWYYYIGTNKSSVNKVDFISSDSLKVIKFDI